MVSFLKCKPFVKCASFYIHVGIIYLWFILICYFHAPIESPLCPSVCPSICLSGTFSGKKLENSCWHLNETWFIDRWQWGEGQNPRTIILPCIFIELLPHNHLFFIMDACPGHILESTQGILMKLGLQIDSSEGKGNARTKMIILSCILT